MLIISSREFRANQKTYLDQVDAGQELLIQRGKDKSYRIVPVTESDIVIDRKYILDPDADLERSLSFEDFKAGALKHIEGLFEAKK
ncbi:MAG: type II toxin-antitoxin system Phd/YefM family antitoxin [Bacteroidetes bacterium]|jgi:antitoxin (DNA-binding transcriptional repressor) of toxin-antitoxin stability system|uniref:Type II toxin-antitoxin system Phd/YefM family antitoxin n=2 Tax=Candidatus Cryptobacteroides TaxID=2840523 RepID=A0A9D9I8D7_9BACT|nr:type II toxin-antitoxin system Phd/YefM family antitoxin [Candidatus Cryptobacteroides faecipullorum]MBO8482722.1 type II toxin-antitoxin system Phd/YefM family antitoxin [Candidatus Cryptobacteroides avicola]